MYFTKPGFTLTEMLIVTVICGILAAVAVPKFFEIKKNTKDYGATVETVTEIVPEIVPTVSVTVKRIPLVVPVSTSNTKDTSSSKTMLELTAVWLGFIFSVFFLTILKEKV